MLRSLFIAFVVLMTTILSAQGPLPDPYQGKFLRIILTVSSLPMTIDTTTPLESFKENGISVSPDSMVVWATSAAMVKKEVASGKLIITGDMSLLREGASIAIVEKDGKPFVVVNLTNLMRCKVKVGDSVIRIGKVIK